MTSFRMAAGPLPGRPPCRGYLTAPANPQAGGPAAAAGPVDSIPGGRVAPPGAIQPIPGRNLPARG